MIWWIAESDASIRGRQIIRKQTPFCAWPGSSYRRRLIAGAPAGSATRAGRRSSVPWLYLLLAVLAGAFWLGIAGLTNFSGPTRKFLGRFCVAAAGGAVAVAIMALSFPEFFLGPFAEVSPIVTAYFLGSISDMRSAFELPLMTVVADYSDGALAIAIVVWLLAAKHKPVSSPAWLFLLLCLVTFFCLAVMHVRFTPAPAVLSAIPFAYFIDIVRRYSSEKLGSASGASLRLAVSFFLVIGPGILLMLLFISIFVKWIGPGRNGRLAPLPNPQDCPLPRRTARHAHHSLAGHLCGSCPPLLHAARGRRYALSQQHQGNRGTPTAS